MNTLLIQNARKLDGISIVDGQDGGELTRVARALSMHSNAPIEEALSLLKEKICAGKINHTLPPLVFSDMGAWQHIVKSTEDAIALLQ